MSAERAYNYIYSKLVEKPDDIVGLIAYGLYKRKKIDYIEHFRSAHDSGPTEADLESFHQISCQHIKEYRDQAEVLMQTSYELSNALSLDRMQKEIADELKERLKGTFVKNVLAGVVSAFVFSFLVGGLFVALVGAKYGTTGIYNMFIHESQTMSEPITKPMLPDVTTPEPPIPGQNKTPIQ